MENDWTKRIKELEAERDKLRDDLSRDKAILQSLLDREREEKRAIEDAMTDLQAAYNRLQKTQGHTLHDWATLNDQTMSLRARVGELEAENKRLRSLVDGVTEVVEIFPCTSPAQMEWKYEWLRNALEALKEASHE